MTDTGTAVQLPRYRSHKEVWALKIKDIQFTPEAEAEELDRVTGYDVGATIIPVESEYAPFSVSREYVAKHNPKPGGYYVVYKDGYKSWSPAPAFEEGYTLI